MVQAIRQTLTETVAESDIWFEKPVSVQNPGKMDMYQWLYFLALHQKHHIAQIKQIYQESQKKCIKMSEFFRYEIKKKPSIQA